MQLLYNFFAASYVCCMFAVVVVVVLFLQNDYQHFHSIIVILFPGAVAAHASTYTLLAMAESPAVIMSEEQSHRRQLVSQSYV